MSAPPVNLNRVRKAKARVSAAAKANENAVKHGRSKVQKELEKARADKHIRALEQHKTEP